jgi:hypothetical protein
VLRDGTDSYHGSVTSTLDSGDHIAGRQTLWMERDVHARFVAMTRARQHTGSHLLACWLERAVVDARAGFPLPPAVPERRVKGSGRTWAKALWKQSDEEYEQWNAILTAAGSSPTAVLRARVNRYLELDGDRVAASTAPLVAA